MYPVSGHITSQCCGSTEIELGTGGEPYLTRSIPGRAALAAKGEACVSVDDVYYVSYRGTLCLEIKQGGTEE